MVGGAQLCSRSSPAMMGPWQGEPETLESDPGFSTQAAVDTAPASGGGDSSAGNTCSRVRA